MIRPRLPFPSVPVAVMLWRLAASAFRVVAALFRAVDDVVRRVWLFGLGVLLFVYRAAWVLCGLCLAAAFLELMFFR